MNTRQKKKHSYLLCFVQGLKHYNRHVFCGKAKKLVNARRLRQLYKNNEYFIDWSEFPDEWYPEQYE